MKKKTKMLLLSALVIGMSISVASAATSTSNIAQKIAEKFNVSADEVQKVIDENGGVMHMGKGGGMENRLADLVSEGKITEEQKTAILNKHEEMRNKMDNLTEEEVEAQREEHRAEMKAFLESIGVDSSLFPQDGPKGGRGGRGMGMHK